MQTYDYIVVGARSAIELAHLTPMQRRAYIIADNKLALNAGWDQEQLEIELGELQLDGFDMSLTGFDEVELAGLLDKNARGGPIPDGVAHTLTGVSEQGFADNQRIIRDYTQLV